MVLLALWGSMEVQMQSLRLHPSLTIKLPRPDSRPVPSAGTLSAKAPAPCAMGYAFAFSINRRMNSGRDLSAVREPHSSDAISADHGLTNCRPIHVQAIFTAHLADPAFVVSTREPGVLLALRFRVDPRPTVVHG